MYSNKAMKKKKRIIEVTILSIIVLWISVFIIDYVRYKNSKQPLLVIAAKTTDFADGSVEEYYSLGWVYREYKRKAIGDIEMTPFWKSMRRPEAKGPLPEAASNYEVPDNPEFLDEYKGIIYFYDYSSLIGTYKCLNTSTSCTKAVSGHDEYNIKAIDLETKLDAEPKFNIYDHRYAFIDDSLPQSANANEKQYTRTIYLFDIPNNKIVGQYRNAKYSTINKDKEADGYLGRFIVQEINGKWGVIEPTGNGPHTIIPFEYDSINFNEATKSYIVKQDGKWFIYNDETDEISNKFDDIILEAYQASGNIYIKTVKTREIGIDTINNYYLHDANGNSLINQDNILSIQIHDSFISYVTKDGILKVMDLTGKDVLGTGLKLYYTSFKTDDENVPAYNLFTYITSDVLITIRKENSEDSVCERYIYNSLNWSLRDQREGKCY